MQSRLFAMEDGSASHRTSDNSDLAFEVCHKFYSKELAKLTKPISKRKQKSWGEDSECYGHIFFGGKRGLAKNLHDFLREIDAVQDILKRPWW